MKLKKPGFLKKAALGAVFFMIGSTGYAADKSIVFKLPDARGLRLFDQAIKLSRRFDTATKKQSEPLKSMLIELSDYHEEEQAGVLQENGKTRGALLPIGPWALARLARLQIQLGDEGAALSLYERLGDDFKGLDVVESEAGTGLLREKAEIASMRGKLRVIQSLLAKGKNENLSDQALDLIFKFQKDYGDQTVSCVTPCGSYGSVALRALWDLLAIKEANVEEWKVKTIKLMKREKDPKLVASTFMALSQAYARLGKGKESKELYDVALKKYAGAAALTGLPEGALKNLIPFDEIGINHGI